MRYRPPSPLRPPRWLRTASRPAFVAVLLAALLVASSGAAGAFSDTGAHSTTAPGTMAGTGSSGLAATCASGSAVTASSGSADGNVSISTWTAPADDADEFQTGADVHEAIASGRLTPDHAGANPYDDDIVAIGDVVVHRIQLNGSASGLLDRLDEQGSDSTTENFRRLVHADNGIDLHYLGPTACPPRLALNESIENGAFRVLSAHERGDLYLVVDVEELYFELGDSGPEAEKWNWGHHQVTVAIDESSGLVSEETVVRDHYEVDRRWVEFETEHDSLVRFNAAPNQTVRGSASMAPGSTVEIELVPLENTNATAAHATNVTLDRDGAFDATFDLSDAPDGTVYTIRIPTTHRDDPPRRLVTVGDATGASLGATDHESIGTILYANGVTTTHGGFLVARNQTTTVAVSEYFGPGYASPQPHYDPLLWQDETLTVTVYQDTNENEQFDPAIDEPYRQGTEPVQTAVNVTVDLSERETTTQSTTEATTSTTTTPPGTSTSTTKSGTTRTSSPTRTSVPTPGFGIGLPLVALLIVGLLVRRG